MARLPYKVIYNDDGGNLFLVAKEAITPEHVDGAVDEVASAGADAFLLCVNAQKVVYPSMVWEKFWEDGGPKAGQTEEHWVGQTRRLAEDYGCNYLERTLARCRQQGIVPGVSIRMNDMHGYPEWPDSPDFSTFYKEHPQW